MSLLAMLLPALVPALSDGVRGIVAKLTGSAGALPQNVGETIQLMNAQTDRVRALAELDKPTGEVSRWVSDFRAIFRYGAIIGIFALTASAIYTDQNEAIVLILLDMSGASMSFIIGERMYLRLKGA